MQMKELFFVAGCQEVTCLFSNLCWRIFRHQMASKPTHQVPQERARLGSMHQSHACKCYTIKTAGFKTTRCVAQLWVVCGLDQTKMQLVCLFVCFCFVVLALFYALVLLFSKNYIFMLPNCCSRSTCCLGGFPMKWVWCDEKSWSVFDSPALRTPTPRPPSHPRPSSTEPAQLQQTGWST